MNRFLTIATLSILAAVLTACGGEASDPTECTLTWQGQPVPCEQSTAASAPGQ